MDQVRGEELAGDDRFAEVAGQIARRLWPEGWWPDARTLGMVLALVFAYFAVEGFTVADRVVDNLLGRIPGAPSGLAYGLPTWSRIDAGARLAVDVGDVVVAAGGLLLVLGARAARPMTATGLLTVLAAEALNTILVLVHIPAVSLVPPIAATVWLLPLVVMVLVVDRTPDATPTLRTDPAES